MKRVKSLVLKGVAQIACQSEATYLGNVGLLRFSRRFPLKRFHEPADVRLHFDLIESERLDFLRHITGGKSCS